MSFQWSRNLEYAVHNRWEINLDTGTLDDDDDDYSRDSVRRRREFRNDMEKLRGQLKVIPVFARGCSKSDDEDDEDENEEERGGGGNGGGGDDKSLDDDDDIQLYVPPGVVRPVPQSINDVIFERDQPRAHDESSFPYMYRDMINGELFTDEWCAGALENALKKWCPSYSSALDSNEIPNPLEFACSRFKVDWDGKGAVPAGIDTTRILKTYQKEMGAVYELQTRACQSNMFRDAFQNDSMRVLHIIYTTYHMLILAISQRSMFERFFSSPDDPTVYTLKPGYENHPDFTPYHKAYWYLTRRIYNFGYRRYKGESLYSRVINPDNHFTHTFKEEIRIDDFVYKTITPQDNVDIWAGITGPGRSYQALIEQLSKCNDPQIPNLVKDRNVHSFRNGLYFIKHDVFVQYDKAKIPNDCIACKYHPNNMNEYSDLRGVDFEGVDCAGDDDLGGPKHAGTAYDIPTPLFDKIMFDQKFPYLVRVWLYVMMGRMLYYARDEDNWQVWMFHFGMANTGKSTMCQIMEQYFYDRVDVAAISNQFERMFGLWGLKDYLAVFCAEVNEDFNMDRTDLQNMITAETVTIRKKNARSENNHAWNTPGMLAGNYVPSWKDPQGAMSRRLLIWNYRYKINVDNKLFKRIESEVPNIILKCNRFYRAALKFVGSNELWSVLPEYFWKQRRMLQAETSPIHGFMDCEDLTIVRDKDGNIDPTVYMPMSTLQKQFNIWRKDANIRGTFKWCKENYQKAFSDIGLGMPVKTRLAYPRDHTDATQQWYLLGVDLAAEIQRLDSARSAIAVRNDDDQ